MPRIELSYSAPDGGEISLAVEDQEPARLTMVHAAAAMERMLRAAFSADGAE